MKINQFGLVCKFNLGDKVFTKEVVDYYGITRPSWRNLEVIKIDYNPIKEPHIRISVMPLDHYGTFCAAEDVFELEPEQNRPLTNLPNR